MRFPTCGPALAGVLFLACSPAPPAPAPAPASPTPVEILVVSTETVRDEVLLPTELEPRRRATLAAEAPGRVERVNGDLGDRVKAGSTLLVVDRRSANEELSSATAVERQARLQRGRAEALAAKRSITNAQLLEAVTQHDVATARLTAAKLALDRTVVLAPWAGEIAARRVEVGDYVVPGQGVLDLVDRSVLIARAPVPAADAPYLELGAEVAVELASRPGERIAARLVRRAPAIDPVSRTLEVEAELAGDAGLPGELAQLALVRRVLADVILVPLTAIVELENSVAVYVVEGSVARRRTVTVVRTLGERVVVDGLAAGDRVIVAGQDRVAEGQSVAEAQVGSGAVDNGVRP